MPPERDRRRQLHDRPIRELLARLATAEAGDAWVDFLNLYSARILQVIRCCERDQDDAADAFVWVCERLADREFRRLRRFDVHGPASFPTWLSVVVHNLCRDWRRATFGRRRLRAILSGLPAFDRAVFGLVVERGLAVERAIPILRQTFPGATPQEIDRAQGWLLQRLAATSSRTDVELAMDDPERRIDAVDEAPTVEEAMLARESRRSLRRALTRLPDADRVLLRLRYQQGLTLGEVARATGLKDAQTADRRLRVAIARLKSFMQR